MFVVGWDKLTNLGPHGPHTPGVGGPEGLCRLHVTIVTVHVNKNLVLDNNINISINENPLSLV